MNYYEHHLGDYAEATSHLTFVEDAAYSRCIRKYYSSEQPLPEDVKQVQRLVGARTREEKQAVESVLREFFVLQPDGWHNARCDEEIARYVDKRTKAKGSANARWNAKRSDDDGDANASETHMRTHAKEDANALPTQCEGNALQSPVSSHQSPDSSKNPPPSEVPPASRAQRLPDDWVLTDTRRMTAERERIDPERTFQKFTDHWRAASGANARKRDWDAAWRNWCRNEADRKPASKVNGNHRDEAPMGKYDRIMAASRALQTFNADGKPLDEEGNVIPF
jgi:uncharacterized protein YdaU (DUF1376 family)